MPDITIAPYRHSDFPQVVELLRTIFPCEPITEASFARRVLLDPNFDAQGALTARDQTGRIVGFILALIRRSALEDAPTDSDRGWITLFGVAQQARRQGIGTCLLTAAENWIRTQARTDVWISPYAPNYWTPGVEEVVHAEGLTFLHRRGYATAYRPLSMDLSLVGWQAPAWIQTRLADLTGRGVTFCPFSPALAGQTTDFLRYEFPGDWQRALRAAMWDMASGRRSQEELHLIAYEQQVLGFAHREGERFGPFGVAKTWRGKGLGATLLAITLEDMRCHGLHNAWFLWTDDRTAERLYKPAGFRETRRYAVLHKSLETARSEPTSLLPPANPIRAM